MAIVSDGIALIGQWLDRSTKRNDRSDAAVKAVLLALNETKAYKTDWESGLRDRSRERLLVQLWTDAAVALRRVDREFAQQLQLKAEYWADPERWTSDDVARAGIQIDAVAAKARSLLGGGA